MPLYDYDCAACGRRFEVVHGVFAEGPTVCPICGKGPIRKAISAAAVHYKGSGWAKKERRVTAGAGSSKSSGDSGPSESGGASSDSGSKSESGSGAGSSDHGSEAGGSDHGSGNGSGSSSTTSTSAKPVKTGNAAATD